MSDEPQPDRLTMWSSFGMVLLVVAAIEWLAPTTPAHVYALGGACGLLFGYIRYRHIHPEGSLV